MNNNKGASLIEVIISIALLSFVMVILVTVFVSTANINSNISYNTKKRTPVVGSLENRILNSGDLTVNEIETEGVTIILKASGAGVGEVDQSYDGTIIKHNYGSETEEKWTGIVKKN